MHFIGGLNKITIVILAMTNLLFLSFLLFCPFILNAFPAPESRSSAQPSVYSWSECDIQNGVVKMTNVCKRLLLCFETELAFGNAKVGMRFYSHSPVANEKAIFGECAEAMEGREWHGLIIAKNPYGQFTIESSLGFSEVLDIDYVYKMENHTEIELSKVFNNGFTLPLTDEFQKAIHLGAFMGDFGGITTHILAKALFSCGQNGTGLCKKKCLFDPVASLREHLDTNWMEIAFSAVGVSKFMLNISAIPYWIACNKYKKKLKIGEPTPPDYVSNGRQYDVNACLKVPETKCSETVEFSACYKSVKNWPAVNNSIAKLCQKHLKATNVAGLNAKICIHQDPDGQKLIVESSFILSFFNETFNLIKHFPISLEQIWEIKSIMPLFFIEFGKNNNQSSIQKRDGEPEKWGNDEDGGIGSVLEDIVPEMINGTWAKVLHFVPPRNVAKMEVFFQTNTPKYAKLITDHTFPAGRDDPTLDRGCDRYGESCEMIKQLVRKIAALKNCTGKEKPKDESMFIMPPWAKTDPKVSKLAPPTDDLSCGSDLGCKIGGEGGLLEKYNERKKACGIEPSAVNDQQHSSYRQKRQYRPDCLNLRNVSPYPDVAPCADDENKGKWMEFPIKIKMDTEDTLKSAEGGSEIWENVAKSGAELIMAKTCVRFEFVDEEEEQHGTEGILVGNMKPYGGCGGGYSFAGKLSGWQYLALGMNCDDLLSIMIVVAGHELMHALGFLHEQNRADARNFVILRDGEDTQTKAVADTENFDFDYDFGSVMHYGASGDHEKRLYDRITLPRFYQQTIGQREEISFKDAAIINRVYCKDSCQNHTDTCKNGGYLNPNDCAKCLCPDGYSGDHCDELEENENCVDLTGNAREFEANQSTQVLKPKIKCTAGGSKCQCHWRIKPKVGKMAVVQFKRLNAEFDCSPICSLAYVEVKYRFDKRVRGAKLCCPDAFLSDDAVSNEYKNWIETKTPDTDIVISARLASSAPLKLAEDEPLFELTYETRDVKLVNSSKCVHPENLFVGKRNPGTGGIDCHSADGTDCGCHGDIVCLSKEKWPRKGSKQYITWRCPIIKINGIQAKGTVGQNKEYLSKYALGVGIPDNWNFALLRCYMAEGGSKSFWGFTDTVNTDVIRVDEIHCLYYETAGVTPPMRLKSVGDGEKQREYEDKEWHNGKGTVFIIEAESNP